MDFPLPMTLRPSPWKTLALMAVSAIFVAAGVWMLPEEPLIGYLCVSFFGLGLIVFPISLLPNASYLRLTREGFTFCSLFRSHTVAWTDVAEFFVVTIGRNKMVGWHYVPEYPDQAVGRAVADSLTDLEGALPDTYGLKPEVLAALMNDLLQAYGRPPGGADGPDGQA